VFPNARAPSGGWPSCARPSGPTPPPSASGSCAPAGARCRSGKELSSLHETLCFARAYPNNHAVLDLVQDLVDRWERRAVSLLKFPQA
jgi:hypothetical protein